uniref:Transposase MuDR plant domain-containing protein n=1 Tax=Noccaea caerulescens TaxID=107243 RepID=A0A1J3IHA9_NOCCA
MGVSVGVMGTLPGQVIEDENMHLMELSGFAFRRDAAPVIDDTEGEAANTTENIILDVAYEGDELFVGRVFKNKQDCKVKIVVHTINRRFSYKHERSNSDFIVVRCVFDACPWMVYVSRMEDTDYFQIRTATLVHSYPVDVRSQFHRQATTSVISEIMRARYAGPGRSPSTVGVIRAMLQEHNVNVSYWKAWRARELAMESANGSASGSYALLPAYLHLLKTSNPGTVTSIETTTDSAGRKRFKFCFLAIGGSVSGIQFMRRVLVIDGAHLRERYAGCILTASAQDGNFQIYPLAFAIVDSENDKAWEWFFENLQSIVPDDESLTFVSDRHSSIYAGLYKVYPKANHGACIVHLQRNVAAKFKVKALAPMISRAARAYKKSTFHDNFSEIELLSPACAEYLRSIGFNHWTRSHCDGERYNVMTSNVA